MDFTAVQSMFTTMPVDVVAAVLFATAITVLTLRAGASLAIAFSLSLVLAPIFVAALPNTFLIGPAVAGLTAPFVAAGVFLGITVLLTAVVFRMTSSLSDDSARPMLSILTGAAATIVVLTVWHMAPALQSLWTFNPAIQAAFSESYRLYWLLAAFTAFAFAKS